MRQLVAAVAILLIFLGSGAVTTSVVAWSAPVASKGGSGSAVAQYETTAPATADSSARPSGCTNGSGPGGYCHPPSEH